MIPTRVRMMGSVTRVSDLTVVCAFWDTQVGNSRVHYNVFVQLLNYFHLLKRKLNRHILLCELLFDIFSRNFLADRELSSEIGNPGKRHLS